MYFVYVIGSKTRGTKHIGQTNNLERRIKEHNSRIGRFTSNKGPWVLLYSEVFESRELAIQREKVLKSGKGRELIRDIVQGK